MTDDPAMDLAVIGAGPAGMAAAVMAATHGLDVVVFDEAPMPGGQVYRALPAAFTVTDRAALGPDHAAAERLRSALAASGARLALGERVWNIGTGFSIGTAGVGRMQGWRAKAVLCATGATERIIPFPGWTTPGVIGLAGATILLKSQRMLPGRRTVVAGAGPLLYAVAAAIVKGGGQVAAVADLASFGEWLAALPALASRPDLLARGAAWRAALRRAGVTVLHRHAVVGVTGEAEVAEVVLRPVDAAGRALPGSAETRIAADSLAIGHGLIPGTEVTRLLRAAHDFVPERGGWIARQDGEGRTSVPGLYVAGDGAGIAGAAAAEHAGEVAALAVLRDLGRLSKEAADAAAAHPRGAMRRAHRFGNAMARMMAARSGLLDAITAETVICRCEDIDRGRIEETLDRGAVTLNQLKSWTRCGMGPCQGRICGDTAAALIAARTGDRAKVGQHTARLPLRPIPVAPIVAGFDYEARVPPPVVVPA